MQMSDGEILQRWNNAVDKKVHVEILADLNAVDKRTMHEKLAELGAEGLPEGPKRRARKAPAEGWVNPNWKIDERKAMELYGAGLCDKDIAAALGMSKTAICQWRKRMQLTPNTTQGGRTKLSDERAMELYRQGMSDREIGDAEGVTKATVRYWRERMGLEPNFKRRDTGQDRTGLDRRCAPVGKEAPVGKQEYMGIEGLLRLTQRMQEAFPQAKVTAGGRSVRDARVHICYNADGEAVSVELDFVLEVEPNEGNT